MALVQMIYGISILYLTDIRRPKLLSDFIPNIISHLGSAYSSGGGAQDMDFGTNSDAPVAGTSHDSGTRPHRRWDISAPRSPSSLADILVIAVLTMVVIPQQDNSRGLANIDPDGWILQKREIRYIVVISVSKYWSAEAFLRVCIMRLSHLSFALGHRMSSWSVALPRRLVSESRMALIYQENEHNIYIYWEGDGKKWFSPVWRPYWIFLVTMATSNLGNIYHKTKGIPLGTCMRNVLSPGSP